MFRLLRESNTPAQRGFRRFERVDEVGNSMEARRARESTTALRVVKTLGCNWPRQLATHPTKHVRGSDTFQCLVSTTLGKKPRRGKSPGRHLAWQFWLNPRPTFRIPVVCQALKGRLRLRVLVNLRREAALERAYGTTWGSKASEGEPQKRDRDEIDPAGYGGSKAPRG